MAASVGWKVKDAIVGFHGIGRLVTIRQEWAKLGPLIDLEAIREPQDSRTDDGRTVGSRVLEHGRRSGA
jgi:hypothetical protein